MIAYSVTRYLVLTLCMVLRNARYLRSVWCLAAPSHSTVTMYDAMEHSLLTRCVVLHSTQYYHSLPGAVRHLVLTWHIMVLQRSQRRTPCPDEYKPHYEIRLRSRAGEFASRFPPPRNQMQLLNGVVQVVWEPCVFRFDFAADVLGSRDPRRASRTPLRCQQTPR